MKSAPVKCGWVCAAIVAVLMGVGCGGQDKAGTAAPEPTSAPSPSVSLPGDVLETEDAAVAAPQETAEDQTGAALTEETLVGTKWQAGPYTLEFQANGALLLNGERPGTWSIEGNALNVAAGDAKYTAEIRGDKLFYGGMPLTRID